VYLVAQRIRLKNSVEEADHLYFYQHADNRLQFGPGELLHMQTTLPCGNNPVLSYVDVLCPEGTSPSQIRSSYMQAVDEQFLVHTSTMPYGYTDTVPGLHEMPRVPCNVAGGYNVVWFNISVPSGLLWFIEAPRLLNLLIDWVEQF